MELREAPETGGTKCVALAPTTPLPVLGRRVLVMIAVSGEENSSPTPCGVSDDASWRRFAFRRRGDERSITDQQRIIG